MKKYYYIGVPVTFLVIFNFGYVFHDLLMGEWLHEKEVLVSRETYIVPVIAVAFFLYTIIQAYLLPFFDFYTQSHYQWRVYKTACMHGALIGFLWDALQGGLIEYATFNIPLVVVLVDSSFHVLEGVYTALILAYFYKRFVLTSRRIGRQYL